MSTDWSNLLYSLSAVSLTGCVCPASSLPCALPLLLPVSLFTLILLVFSSWVTLHIFSSFPDPSTPHLLLVFPLLGKCCCSAWLTTLQNQTREKWRLGFWQHLLSTSSKYSSLPGGSQHCLLFPPIYSSSILASSTLASLFFTSTRPCHIFFFSWSNVLIPSALSSLLPPDSLIVRLDKVSLAHLMLQQWAECAIDARSPGGFQDLYPAPFLTLLMLALLLGDSSFALLERLCAQEQFKTRPSAWAQQGVFTAVYLQLGPCDSPCSNHTLVSTGGFSLHTLFRFIVPISLFPLYLL